MKEKDVIKLILKYAPLYVTMDYGHIYYNHNKRHLWLVGGDGGYWYFKNNKTLKHFQDNFDDYGDKYKLPSNNSYITFNEQPGLQFLSEDWKAENFPYDDDDDNLSGYKLIGNVTVINY